MMTSSAKTGKAMDFIMGIVKHEPDLLSEVVYCL